MHHRIKTLFDLAADNIERKNIQNAPLEGQMCIYDYPEYLPESNCQKKDCIFQSKREATI